MRARRELGSKARAAVSALALLVAGAVVAQDPPPPPAPDAAKGAAPNPKEKDANPKGKVAKKRGVRLPRREPGKGVPKGGDPLIGPAAAVDANGKPLPLGSYHYKFKVAVNNADPLAMTYYPSKLGDTAAAVVLVHERERSGKDFTEEEIADLKNLTLAEELQKLGYAVLVLDLRGHGGNSRRAVPKAEWPSVPADVQVAYYCLLDRHNRGELNLAKLGVVALGEGANVASAWAAGGGGVSSEGRTSDLGALVAISPMVDAQSQGVKAGPALAALAARVPIDLLYGERDTATLEVVDSVKAILKRYRSNQVEPFPSALHGYRLLRLEPNLTGAITKFLDATIKAKADEWEGRYLLNPLTYTEIKVIPNPVRVDPATKKAAR